MVSDNCTNCRSGSEVRHHPRPSPQEFMEFLPWFLKDNPGISCGKGWVRSCSCLYLVRERLWLGYDVFLIVMQTFTLHGRSRHCIATPSYIAARPNASNWVSKQRNGRVATLRKPPHRSNSDSLLRLRSRNSATWRSRRGSLLLRTRTRPVTISDL